MFVHTWLRKRQLCSCIAAKQRQHLLSARPQLLPLTPCCLANWLGQATVHVLQSRQQKIGFEA